MADNEVFLKKYMSEFIQKIRNPVGLADALYAKRFIKKELYQNINAQKTNLKKTREIYESLNTTKHYDCMYDWLKENESDVLKELELLHRKRDTEAEAPQKKKARLKNEDETDNNLIGFPDLKRISTFAKLERWVSEPEISQKLISDLERQLGDKGMADLKNKLKNKEPKNILCFNANNIDTIRKNKKLDKFLSQTNNTEIPELTFTMFFKKGGSASSGNKAQSSDMQDSHNDEIDEESTDMQGTHIDEKEEQSQRSKVPGYEGLSPHQNEPFTKKKTPLENRCGSTDMQETHIDEMKEQPQRFNVPNVPRHVDVSLSQYNPFTKKEPLEDGLGTTDMKEPCTDKIDEQLIRSNVPMHEDEFLHQKEQITKKETPLEDGLGSMDMQDTYNDEIDEESTDMQGTHIDEKEEQSQRSNVPIHEALSLHQNEPFTKKETPLENRCGNTDMQETHIHEMKEQPQRFNVPNVPRHIDVGTDMKQPCTDEIDEQVKRSHVPKHEDEFLHQKEQITKKETPLENRCGSTDMQETHIDEMKVQPQRFNVPNVPRHVDVSLSQYNPFTKKEPLEDGLGSTDMKEPCTDKIDEQLIRSNVPKHEDEFLHQKEQITKKETPLEDGLGSMDMQDTNIDEIDVESQRSNVPMHAASLHQDESIIKNKMPLEDRCGNMNMQHNEQANMQVNPEPFSSKQLQDYSPGSASEYTQSNGTESLAQYKNTAILAPNRNVKDRTEATKKREKSKCQKEKKKKLKDDLLHDWAMRQCNDRKEELKNILDQISIITMAEHSDYPCFTAEDVMVYKYLTPESQIIFIADDNTSINTKTMVHYHMFVCNIKKAILLGPKKPKEQEIQYIESKVPIDMCTGFIFKAFAPALTVYKKIQKEEKLYSLI